MKKILFIAHSNVIAMYQNKLNFIAENNIVYLVVPEIYKENMQLVNATKIENSKFDFFKLKTFLGKKGKQHFHFYFGLQDVIEKVQPDIIHLEEEPRSLVSFQTIYLAKRYNQNIRIVFFSALSIRKDWNNIFNIYDIRKYIFPKIQKYTFNNTDAAIAVSDSAKDVLEWQGYKKSIYILPQNAGVLQTDFFETRVKEKVVTIGFVGRFEHTKGLHVLLESFKDIKKKHKSVNLIIVGRGKKEIEYKQYIKQHDLDDSIDFISYCEYNQMCQYFNSIDILVLPSIESDDIKEQFGRVLVEAAFCKTLAIGSAIDGIKFALGDNELCFEQDNVLSLSSKLNYLIENPEIFRKKIGTLYEYVDKNFSVKSIANSLNDIYKGL